MPNKNTRVVLVDDSKTGSLERSMEAPRGQLSRALLGAYRLKLAGYSDVRFMQGGINQWTAKGYAMAKG